MDILDAIGNTSLVRLSKVVPGRTVVTLMVDSGLKYLSTDVYRRP